MQQNVFTERSESYLNATVQHQLKSKKKNKIKKWFANLIDNLFLPKIKLLCK